MPRIRTIKPEFCVSDQLAECSTNARLLFILMWCHCDDNGIHPSRMKSLKMACFPADNFTVDDIRGMVDELIAVGLLMEYEAAGEQYLIVTGWKKHQKIDRPNPKYPLPPIQKSEKPREQVADNSTNDRRAITPGREGKGIGVEGKGVEKEKNSSKKEKDINPLSEQYPDYRPDVLNALYRWMNWYRQKWIAEFSDVDIQEDLKFLDEFENPMEIVEFSIRYKSRRLLKPKYPLSKPDDPPAQSQANKPDQEVRTITLEEARKLAV